MKTVRNKNGELLKVRKIHDSRIGSDAYGKEMNALFGVDSKGVEFCQKTRHGILISDEQMDDLIAEGVFEIAHE